jgi:hypothetical protein
MQAFDASDDSSAAALRSDNFGYVVLVPLLYHYM